MTITEKIDEILNRTRSINLMLFMNIILSFLILVFLWITQ